MIDCLSGSNIFHGKPFVSSHVVEEDRLEFGKFERKAARRHTELCNTVPDSELELIFTVEAAATFKYWNHTRQKFVRFSFDNCLRLAVFDV